jgi:hypothetical protein
VLIARSSLMRHGYMPPSKEDDVSGVAEKRNNI